MLILKNIKTGEVLRPKTDGIPRVLSEVLLMGMAIPFTVFIPIARKVLLVFFLLSKKVLYLI